MKLVYLKLFDPIAWHKPDYVFYAEDLENMKLAVDRIGGIFIKETETEIFLGTAQIAKDNPELEQEGFKYPRYRNLTIVAKCNIKDRQDFEIKEDDVKE